MDSTVIVNFLNMHSFKKEEATKKVLESIFVKVLKKNKIYKVVLVTIKTELE